MLRQRVRGFVVAMLVASGASCSALAVPALALNGYVPGGTFGAAGAGAGELEAPEGVAVNRTTGDVYIADTGNDRVSEFNGTGEFIRAWGWGVGDGLSALEVCTLSCEKGIAGAGAGQFSKPSYVAVDNSSEVGDTAKGNVYVADTTNNVVEQFTEDGQFIGSFAGSCETPGEAQPCSGGALIPFGEVFGVATDASGDLWTYDGRNGHIDEFDSTGHFVKTIVSESFPAPGGLAIDSHNTLYVTGRGVSAVLRFSAETGEALPQLSPVLELTSGVTAIAVGPTTNNIVVDDENRLDLYGPFGEEHANKPLQIVTTDGFAESHGVAVNEQGTAFVSERSANRVQVFSYGPLVPAVTEQSVGAVSATEAVVKAEVNPFSETATYSFEYGLTPTYGGSTPETSVGAPSEDVPVQATLRGLVANTTYHFRVRVTTAAGSVVGPDASFSTAGGSAAAEVLPDGRAYELVSDAVESGEAYVPFGLAPPSTELVPSTQPFRSSADGEVLAYVGEAGPTGGNGLTGNGAGNELISRRDAQAGLWTVTDITPQVGEAGESERNATYEAFTEDMSAGVFSVVTSPHFSASTAPQGPSETCGAIFKRTDKGTGALFSEKQGTGSLACGKVAEGRYGPQNLLFAGGNSGTATTPAFSQVLVQTPAPLTPGDSQSPEREEGNNLYLSVEGHVRHVGVLPNGEHDADAVFGSTSGEPLKESRSGPGNFSNIISDDGSRIFWTALEPAEENFEPVPERLKALYVREDAVSPAPRTIQLDTSEAPAGTGVKEKEERAERSGGGRFWTATPDGSKVFFTDCSRLTEDSTAQAGEGCVHTSGPEVTTTGNDLYEYDFSKPPGSRLVDLTPDTSGSDSLGADVQGVIGASDDGEYVYFVANGVLAGTNSKGAEPTSGRPNLYLRHGGVTTFVAGLNAQTDNEIIAVAQGLIGDWRPDLARKSAAVSPDGHHLVFQSTEQLTPFENQGAREIYIYGTEGASGDLICASCVVGSQSGGPEGSYLPVTLNPTFLRRWMSGDGNRVFFNSDENLVSQDNNGVQDVYEWERAGHGSCTLEPGCIFLVSGATNATPSYFLDADDTGDNIFFTHRGVLGHAGRASTHNLVLDARVAGGFPRPASGECATCQPGVQPSPTFSPPSSALAAGGDNVTPPAPSKSKPRTPAEIRAERLVKALKACRGKHNKRKRVACERQARRRLGPPQRGHKKSGKTEKAKKTIRRGGR